MTVYGSHSLNDMKGIIMNYSVLFTLLVAALGLVACNRPTVVNAPLASE